MDGDAPNDVRFATHDLTNHLERMTGAAFAIVTAPPADGTPSIECGTDRARQAALVTAGTLADGEAAVVCDGKDILIWGAGANGTSNGIYAFLERKLGCRWLTPWDEPFIPSRRDLRLEPFTLVYRPRLKVRWLLTALGSASQAKNGALFLYRNRENVKDQPGFGSNYDRPEGCTILKHDRYSVAPSVHTMFYYLPPADKDGRKGYFKDHPDWYSLNRKGVRTDKMQVCFSNPDACATFASNFFARVKKGGGRGYFNISQTDDDGDVFCHCADCEACVKKYGTPGAPFFVFLKRTAEELARRFPDGTTLDIAQARDECFISMAPGHSVRTIQDRLFEEYGMHPRILLETHNMEAAKSIAARSGAVFLLPSVYAPDSMVDRYRVHVYPVSNTNFERHFYFCYRQGMYLTRYERDLAQIVCDRLHVPCTLSEDHSESANS